ncbi:hypothetical protein GS473_21365 [Rhodococcus hoagii]|nr:hypothetical protein [Prescottella equi]
MGDGFQAFRHGGQLARNAALLLLEQSRGIVPTKWAWSRRVRSLVRQYPDMAAPKAVPSAEDLVADLERLRQRGWRRAHTHHLPALDFAAHLTHLTTEASAEPAVIETLLRRSVERLGAGEFGQAAMLTFGLEVDTKFLSSTKRRQRAAACIEPDGVTPDYFRKTYERKGHLHPCCRGNNRTL